MLWLTISPPWLPTWPRPVHSLICGVTVEGDCAVVIPWVRLKFANHSGLSAAVQFHGSSLYTCVISKDDTPQAFPMEYSLIMDNPARLVLKLRIRGNVLIRVVWRHR